MKELTKEEMIKIEGGTSETGRIAETIIKCIELKLPKDAHLNPYRHQ